MGSQNSWGSVIGEITFTCFWSVCMIPAAIPHQPHEGTWTLQCSLQDQASHVDLAGAGAKNL